eukprot:3383419-Pyramimonas_sp.AAC.1
MSAPGGLWKRQPLRLPMRKTTWPEGPLVSRATFFRPLRELVSAAELGFASLRAFIADVSFRRLSR